MPRLGEIRDPLPRERLERVWIRRFRNLSNVAAAPDGLWVMFGRNGAGKTNVLESIASLTTRERSPVRERDFVAGAAIVALPPRTGAEGLGAFLV